MIKFKKVVLVLGILYLLSTRVYLVSYSLTSSVIDSNGTYSLNASYSNLSAGGQGIIGESYVI